MVYKLFSHLACSNLIGQNITYGTNVHVHACTKIKVYTCPCTCMYMVKVMLVIYLFVNIISFLSLHRNSWKKGVRTVCMYSLHACTGIAGISIEQNPNQVLIDIHNI